MGFWDFFWLMVWAFFFVAYLLVLFRIVGDIFRDTTLSGLLKAVWILALIIVPVLTALVYLIVRGRAMTERDLTVSSAAEAATHQYIQSAVGRSDPAQQITTAKGLLDTGVITHAEFDRIKQKALA